MRVPLVQSDGDLHSCHTCPTERQEDLALEPCGEDEGLSAIDRGLDGYCDKPSPAAFMQIYTCVYDLCNNRDRKQLVCQAVYNKYHQETLLCIQRLNESMESLTEAARSPSGASGSAKAWWTRADTSIGEWRRLERRLYALQSSFGYLDRYYVPRAQLASLDSLRTQALEEEAFEDKAREMWESIAVALREGRARIGFQLMSILQENWAALQRAASLKASGPSGEWFSEALREHLATTFVEGFYPRGQPAIATCPCTATARVLGMQRPLVRLILEYLSEQDLTIVYSTNSTERST